MIEGPWKLPAGWRWEKLSTACELNPRRPALSRTDESPTSFVPMSSVDEETGTIADLHVRPFSEVKKGYTYFGEDDVLFAKITPCMQNGKAAIARELSDGIGFGSTEFHVLRPKERVISEWIFYFIRQERFREEAQKRFRGAVGQQRIPEDFLQGYSIPIPPTTDEQRRIVAKIEALFDRIREAKRLRSETSSDANILVASTLADVFRDLGSSWPVSTIKELQDDGKLQIFGGGTPSKKNATFWRGRLPWVSPKDMKRWEIDDTEDHISAEAVRASSVKLVPAGAVLIVVRGMILERAWPIAVARVQLTVNQDMKGLLPSNRLLPDFLAYALKFREPEVLQKIETAGHGTRRLRSAVLESLEVPIPSLPEQKRIVDYLNQTAETITTLKHRQEQSGTELQQVEQSILDRAFRGEL